MNKRSHTGAFETLGCGFFSLHSKKQDAAASLHLEGRFNSKRTGKRITFTSRFITLWFYQGPREASSNLHFDADTHRVKSVPTSIPNLSSPRHSWHIPVYDDFDRSQGLGSHSPVLTAWLGSKPPPPPPPPPLVVLVLLLSGPTGEHTIDIPLTHQVKG